MKRALPLLLLLLGTAAAPAAAAVDPFYRNRLESGYRAYEQGNWEEAAKELRIACFGHLDEPVTLVEGLVRLAVVEAALGDEEAFRRIFSRLVELEERFSAYSAAQVPPAVRERFEGLAARLVPAEILRTAVGFQAIAERAEIQRLAGLPPAERRTELEARLRAEPERGDWLVEMAKLELELRRPRPALDWLDRLPPAVTGLPPASCLRQQAASESGDCGRMDLTGPFCANVPPGVVEFRLQCLVEAERWAEAAALIDGLDPELRARRRLARLERRVRNNLEAPAATEAAAAAAGLPGADPPPTAGAAEPPPPVVASPRPPAEAAELERLRQQLAAATTGEQLAALMAEVEGLVERRPAARPARLLAAEIAYLQSDWRRAVRHFRQAGQLGPEEAHLAFYLAVALYQSGEPAAAAEVLGPVAGRLERTSFVDAWVERIMEP